MCSWRAWSKQHSVLERALAQREEVFSLTRQRVSAGLDTAVELRQSEGARPETRQQLESSMSRSAWPACAGRARRRAAAGLRRACAGLSSLHRWPCRTSFPPT